jgi:hypothetical protein
MRVLPLAILLVLTILISTGCSAEDPTQRFVRERVDAYVAALGGYPGERSHCTRTPRPWFVEQATNVYICAVPRDDGDCDWFTARFTELDVKIQRTTIRGGCVLPI